MNGEGCAVIQVRAIPNADNNGNGTGPGGGGTNSSASNPGNPPAPDAVDIGNNPDKPPELYCSDFLLSWGGYLFGYNNPSNALSERDLYREYAQGSHQTGGTSEDSTCTTQIMANGSMGTCLNVVYRNQWDTNRNEIIVMESSTNGCGTATNLHSLAPADLPPPFVTATAFPGMNGTGDIVQVVSGSNSYVQLSVQSATTTYRLRTGGRLVPGRQGLHAIAANAVAIVQHSYESAFDDWLSNSLPTANIPPQQLSIMRQSEDANGNVWTVLADGQDLELPITVPSVAYYITTPTDTKYPQISFTGLDATGIYWRGWDATDTNIDIMVGQQVKLTSYLGEGAPACSNFSWSVPATAESEFFVSTDDLWTNGYPIALEASMLTNTDNASFFWADGATSGLTKNVSFTAEVFGQTITAALTFTVFRPSVTVTYNIGTVRIGSNANGNPYIYFGDPAPGVQFSNTISVPSGFAGYDTEWIQLIANWTTTETISNSVNSVTNYGAQTIGVVLDTQYPYDDYANQNPIPDAPAEPLGCANQIAGSDSQSSQMWLMFAPSGSLNPSLSINWVPLWITTWSCTATANGFGPNPSNWTMSDTNISVTGNHDSGTTYPIWTNNVKNFDTNKPPKPPQ